MKFLVVVAAFLALASAEVREKRGIIGSTVLAGPSGTIVSNPGVIAAHGIASPLLARSVIAPGLVGHGLVAPGLIAPGAILAAPGITAGTVVAPGTTLIGPNTNGAPGAVITNSIYGTQILV